jgi:hypothetical protein
MFDPFLFKKEFFWQYWIWTPGLALARMVFYHLSQVLNTFCFSYFCDKFCIMCLAWTMILLTMPSTQVGLKLWAIITGLLRWVQLTFVPGWSQTTILLISNPQVAGIIDINCPAWYLFLKFSFSFFSFSLSLSTLV